MKRKLKFKRILLKLSGEVLANRELLQRARLLPPQIAQVAMLLGPAFDGVFTDDEMIKKIKEM